MKLTLARDNGDISTMRMLGINLQMEAADFRKHSQPSWVPEDIP